MRYYSSDDEYAFGTFCMLKDKVSGLEKKNKEWVEKVRLFQEEISRLRQQNSDYQGLKRENDALVRENREFIRTQQEIAVEKEEIQKEYRHVVSEMQRIRKSTATNVLCAAFIGAVIAAIPTCIISGASVPAPQSVQQKQQDMPGRADMKEKGSILSETYDREYETYKRELSPR